MSESGGFFKCNNFRQTHAVNMKLFTQAVNTTANQII